LNARRTYAFRGLVGAYIFLLVGGLTAYIFLGGPPEHVAWTAPLFMLLAGILTLITLRPGDRLSVFMAGLIGYGSEVLGVHTGFPFGGYEYTQAFAPLLFGVPLVLIAAWVILIAYVREMLRPFHLNRWLEPVAVALWMVTIDLVLDPVAAGPLDLWRWDAPGAYYGIPVSNFAGWIIVSAFIAVVCPRPVQAAKGPRLIGFSIVLFFLVHALTNGMAAAALAGVVLLLVHGFLARAGSTA